METKLTLIIRDVLNDFLPGGRSLLSNLSDFKINEWRYVGASCSLAVFLSLLLHLWLECADTPPTMTR